MKFIFVGKHSAINIDHISKMKIKKHERRWLIVITQPPGGELAIELGSEIDTEEKACAELARIVEGINAG